jgi:S1-C subfamily serine protease
MLLLSLALAAAAGAQVPGGNDPQEIYGARWTPEAAVYRSAAPCVVRVRLEARLDGLSARFGSIEIGGTGERWVGVSNGTGVVYSEQGLVITNAHVVNTSEEIDPKDLRLRVRLSGAATGEEGERDFPARLLALDPEIDLALLQIDSDRAFSRIAFGKENDLLIGEKVIALGAPFGGSLMLSSGILSALNQEVTLEERDGSTRLMQGLIQTDAAINEGFSGGPLMNVYGELIGLSVSRVDGAEGIAYAIPIAQINESLRESLLGGLATLGLWTGMEVGPASPEVWPRVEEVHPRGPAARAGFLAGDRILLVNREPVSRLEQWADELLRHAAGETLEIVVRRGRNSQGLSLELAEPSQRDSLGLFGAEFGRGSYSLRDGTGTNALQYECQRIEQVYPGSPADRLGLRRGDLVLMVGVDDPRFPRGWAKVRSASELIALMRGPTFKLDAENIWIARDEETFRGVLPVDDPAVLRNASPKSVSAANRENAETTAIPAKSPQSESPRGR